jgi:hypothetical protein
VINHFYVHNMGVDRGGNPSLRNFKMVPKGKNALEFLPKSNEHDVNGQDQLDIVVLDSLDELKAFYQTPTEKEIAK